MALHLEHDPNTGFTVNYWRIVAISINLLYGKCAIKIAGYISEEARRSGKNPIYYSERTLEIKDPQGYKLDQPALPQLYKLLKQADETPDQKSIQAGILFNKATDLL